MNSRDVRDNRVTDEGYWDGIWAPMSDSAGRLSATDFYFGRRGLFCKLIEDKIGSLAGKRVVEFGGGGVNYRLLALAKWMGANVTAVDFSSEGLGVAKRLFELNGCEASFVLGDICTWSSSEPFDLVVHWGVIEHFVDPAPIIERSYKVLRPGGELIFSVPNMEAIGAAFWKRWSPENWSKHVFHPTRVLDASLHGAGFADVSCFYFGVPFLKTVEWEKRSLGQVPIDALQKAASALARVVPVCHRAGHRSISMERGFHARKRA